MTVVLSAYSNHCSVGVFLLIGRSLDANVNLVITGDRGRLVVADVAIKNFEFWMVVVYAPSCFGERRSFFRRLGRSLTI